jgi:hypothetical protein
MVDVTSPEAGNYGIFDVMYCEDLHSSKPRNTTDSHVSPGTCPLWLRPQTSQSQMPDWFPEINI